MKYRITSQINSMLYQLNGDGKTVNDARQIMDNLVVASENAKEISGNAKEISGKINGIMNGQTNFDVSVSGELLYNTKKDDFSPNLFLRIGKGTYGLLGIESLTNDPVYDAVFGRTRDIRLSCRHYQKQTGCRCGLRKEPVEILGRPLRSQ